MDSLEEYRNRHHRKYLERERQREIIEYEEEQRIEKYIEEINMFCNLLENAHSLNEAKEILENLKSKIDVNIKDESLSSIGSIILNILHSNPNVKINVLEPLDITTSQSIKELAIFILTALGLDAGDIDLEFDMDCSKDEEIARALAASWEPPIVVPRRGRPRKNNRIHNRGGDGGTGGNRGGDGN